MVTVLLAGAATAGAVGFVVVPEGIVIVGDNGAVPVVVGRVGDCADGTLLRFGEAGTVLRVGDCTAGPPLCVGDVTAGIVFLFGDCTLGEAARIGDFTVGTVFRVGECTIDVSCLVGD